MPIPPQGVAAFSLDTPQSSSPPASISAVHISDEVSEIDSLQVNGERCECDLDAYVCARAEDEIYGRLCQRVCEEITQVVDERRDVDAVTPAMNVGEVAAPEAATNAIGKSIDDAAHVNVVDDGATAAVACSAMQDDELDGVTAGEDGLGEGGPLMHRFAPDLDGVDNSKSPERSSSDLGRMLSSWAEQNGACSSVQSMRLDATREAIQKVSRDGLHEDGVWRNAAHWQLKPWFPDGKVVSYLAQFGLEAEDLMNWRETPEESRVKLEVNLPGHSEHGGATWYQLECRLVRQAGSPENSVTRWLAPRRLCQIRVSLHDCVSDALASRYNWLFEDAPFALRGAPKGTTARLRQWFTTLLDHLNDGTLTPELVALTFFFVHAPVFDSGGKEIAAPDFYTASPGIDA